jgi:hypothetical protein
MWADLTFSNLELLLSYSGRKVIIKKKSGEFEQGYIRGYFLNNPDLPDSTVWAICLSNELVKLHPNSYNLVPMDGRKIFTHEITSIELLPF